MLAAATESARPGFFEVNKRELGNRIRSLREGKEMTQSELGRLLEKSRSAIAQWENGNAIPALEDFHAMAFHLNTTAPYIAFGITQQAKDSFRIPVVNYTKEGSAPAGEMALDLDFYKELHRAPGAKLRAYRLQHHDMLEGMKKGDMVIIDEADRTAHGLNETFLIFFGEAAVAHVNVLPGEGNMAQVEIGRRPIQMKRPEIPILGRVIATIQNRT